MFVYGCWQSRLSALRHVHRLPVALMASRSGSSSIRSKPLHQLPSRGILFRRLFSSSSENQQSATSEKATESKTKPDINLMKNTRQQISKSYLEEVFEAPPEQEAKTVGQKVKRGAESTFYVVVIIGAFAGFFALFYLVMRESFGLDTPTGAYNKTLDLIRKDPRCMAIFGEKALGHGETSSRGRRRHVQSKESVVAGKPIRQLVFYLKGNGRTGKAYAETEMDEYGRWDYRLLAVVTSDSVVPEKVILIDRR